MSAIPCKQPKVTVEPSAVGGGGLYDHVCHVPGCGWTYRSVKSDHLGAPHHRREHRDAVPKTWITTPTTQGPEYDVYCTPCGGHRRTFGTRTDAQAWLDYHLSSEHGLVTCS